VFCFRDVRTSEIKLQLNNAVGGRLKRSPDRRQFCFISVLFHDVGRTSNTTHIVLWCVD